jgi:2-polyprenyl-3-methyl-5-hydroxy-6-metoxy-1,4-benzoquinol methylase
MARIDRQKRALGGAVMRQKPSRTAEMLVRRGLVKGRVLDFGCGHGFDADTFGWESYDPYYRPIKPVGPFDTIVCIHVLSALTRNNRSRVTSRIRELLAIGGMAYLAVPRDIPVSGKLGIHHNLQNHVALTLPSIFADKKLEIYAMHKTADFEDKTRDYISRRDRCRDR